MEKKEVNPHASALGRLCKGVPKTLTDEQRRAKAKIMAKARETRWVKRDENKLES